jgi:hypothetical protein
MRTQGARAESQDLAVKEHTHEGNNQTPRVFPSRARKTEICAVFLGGPG